MASTITPAQLEQVETALDTATRSPTAANIAAVWNLLSSFGDTYANAAYDVLAEPTSFYGEVTRNAFAVNGADFNTEFLPVGLSHLTTYVGDISNAPDPLGSGNYLLPRSTDIESSYCNASAEGPDGWVHWAWSSFKATVIPEGRDFMIRASPLGTYCYPSGTYIKLLPGAGRHMAAVGLACSWFITDSGSFLVSEDEYQRYCIDHQPGTNVILEACRAAEIDSRMPRANPSQR